MEELEVNDMTKLLLHLFVKDKGSRAAYGKLSGIVGIICNVLLFAAKLIIGLLSGSVSITADAMNNLSDASSSIVTMIGFRMAEKPADEDHPYGHARAEYITGLCVAAFILLIGWELGKSSFQKILNPEPVAFSWLMAAVLLLSMAAKLWLALFNLHLGKKIHSSALLAASVDSRNDVIATAAVLISCLVGMLTDFNPDGYVGILVALFILYSGVQIARDTIDPLLGKAPDAELVNSIREKLLSYEYVLGIHDLMVHDYGPGRRFASVHVEMDRELDPLFSHNIIDEIEREFEQSENIQLVVHYDPMVTDDEEVNETKKFVEAIVKTLDKRLSIHDFRLVAGPKHTNVVFDLVVPFGLEQTADDLCNSIVQAIRKAKPNYYAVIHVDSASFN